MASLNQAMVIGFLGDEPKVNTTQSERKVASFSIATTEKGYTARNGTQIPNRTEWHNIVLWGKLAEVAEMFLHKGSSVYVQGKMRTRTYEDKNGIKRYITEIEGETMQMLDRKAEYNQNGGQQQQTQQTATYQPQTPNFPNANKKDDDLPF